MNVLSSLQAPVPVSIQYLADIYIYLVGKWSYIFPVYNETGQKKKPTQTARHSFVCMCVHGIYVRCTHICMQACTFLSTSVYAEARGGHQVSITLQLLRWERINEPGVKLTASTRRDLPVSAHNRVGTCGCWDLNSANS